MHIIDIGCGDRKRAGCLGIDFRKTGVVDIIADAKHLPFKDNTIDHLYATHLIEHFGIDEIDGILEEWARVITCGGTVELRCPWLRIRALLMFLFPGEANIRCIYGEQNYPGNFHRSGYTYKILRKKLERLGIGNVRRVYRYGDLHVTGVKCRSAPQANRPGHPPGIYPAATISVR